MNAAVSNMADRPVSGFRNPTSLNSWIAVLFMVGAALFALGSAIYLNGFTHEYTLDTVFFVGSLFFTSAAYCQFHQEINTLSTQITKRHQWLKFSADRLSYWSALCQFIGTLLFNANTFDAFFDLGWIENELMVWTPNILGSILFLVSGSLAICVLCRGRWYWNLQNRDWWINAINFAGCVTFLASAIRAYIPPPPDAEIHAFAATALTLIGAICFFTGAFLMWMDNTPNKA